MQKKGSKGPVCTFHRTLLLPVNRLPLDIGSTGEAVPSKNHPRRVTHSSRKPSPCSSHSSSISTSITESEDDLYLPNQPKHLIDIPLEPVENLLEKMEPIMQPNYTNGDVDSVPGSDDEPVPAIENHNIDRNLHTDDNVSDVENQEPIQHDDQTFQLNLVLADQTE